MAAGKLISVVIPCYNSKKYLDKCFGSLLSQTIGFENIEVILVNDASTDNTLDTLLEIEHKYPDNVMVINLDTNMQQGGARNIGISYATGEYLAFVDSDDWIDPETYAITYKIAKDKDLDIIQFNTFEKTMDERDQSANRMIGLEDYFVEFNSVEERRSVIINQRFTCGCWNKLYRMSLVREVNSKFTEHACYEEPKFVFPFFFYAKRMYRLEQRLYYYRYNYSGTVNLTMTNNLKLYDHPKTQLELLNDLIARNLVTDYHDEIEFLFFHCYYVETLYFAAMRGFTLDPVRFKQMQQTVKNYFPNIYNNKYISLSQYAIQNALLQTLNLDLDENAINIILDGVKQDNT